LQHTAPTLSYTLSLHDALPIYPYTAGRASLIGLCAHPGLDYARSQYQMPDIFSCLSSPYTSRQRQDQLMSQSLMSARAFPSVLRSEEHTSELQSRENLVCRLLL